MTLAELEKLSFEFPIILFDGLCFLCEKTIQDILKADKQGLLRYKMLQNVEGTQGDTVVLIHRGNRFEQSDVLIELNELIGFNKYNWIKYLPKFVRNLGYKLIASNRYRLFGKKEACLLPPSFPHHLFLDRQ